ncbi:MAG: DUF1049 domain-containing protein [Pleurocapsa sp. SU_196_0]|jgi:uncharacterized integral membrane protein|nr:DUF1049 domain-containing protein [Pleurocapsa sp. SU_196_0]
MKALQYLQVFLLIGGIVYLAVFHFRNVGNGAVIFDLPFAAPVGGPASLALLFGFLGGLLYGLLIASPQLVRRAVSMRSMSKRIRELENENAKLRPAASTPRIPDRNDPDGLEELRSQGKI